MKKKFKLFLKNLSLKDISLPYLNWMNDYEVVRFTEQRYRKHKMSDVKKFVKSKINSNTEYLYGIFLKNKKNIHIGNLKIGPIDKFHKTAEISYLIGDKKLWNKGLGSLALKKGIILSKKKFKLKKLIAGTYESNKASIKILKKNKFKKEGILKSNIIFEKKRINKLIFGLIL